MTAEFNDLGFQFLYPENWKLVCENHRGWPRSVSVHSPDGALWMATIDRPPDDRLFDQMVQLMHREYEDVESEPIERNLAELQLSGVEMRFYCLDLLVTAQIVHCPTSPRPAVLLLQGEDREFAELVRVFDAMSITFLRNLSAPIPGADA